MLEGKRVAVVVPAYDEENLVVDSSLGGIPEPVDRVYVVDDASRDGRARKASATLASR